MQEFKNYLESLTVHGLVYIVWTKKVIRRLFWILVIFFGFTAATLLILESFQSWAETRKSSVDHNRNDAINKVNLS